MQPRLCNITLLYIVTLVSSIWHKMNTDKYSLNAASLSGVVVGVCCYANASPVSQEEIKADNSSSNSFLLHPSVMPTTVHILERKRICFLLSVCVCVQNCTSPHRRNVCLSCTVMWAVEEAEWRHQLYLTLEWSGFVLRGGWHTPLNNYCGEEETGGERRNSRR